MLTYGFKMLSRGLRRGVPANAVLGTALVALALLRRKRPREVLYQTTLKPGQSLRIERPGAGSVDVTGAG